MERCLLLILLITDPNDPPTTWSDSKQQDLGYIFFYKNELSMCFFGIEKIPTNCDILTDCFVFSFFWICYADKVFFFKNLRDNLNWRCVKESKCIFRDRENPYKLWYLNPIHLTQIMIWNLYINRICTQQQRFNQTWNKFF